MILEFTVNKPGTEVFNYLTDMQKFVTIHPIIFRIDKLQGNEYLVYEKLKILFIPVTFKYKAIVEGNATGDNVLIKATVMNMIHITMNFDLSKANGQTKVKEQIDFKSVLPVHLVMAKIFKTQHQQLFSNMDKA